MTTTTPVTTTLADLFSGTAAEHGSMPALRAAGAGEGWTWSEYANRVRAAAAGLAGLGLARGDTMACWLSNRPEFHVADAAAMQLGAACFSVYPTFTVPQAEHIVGDAGAKVLVTEPAYLEAALATRDGGRTQVETVVLVEGEYAEATSWDELLECARPDFDPAAAAAAVEPSDLATLIYTSGTTGPPKGVQLTHANIVATLCAMQERLAFPVGLHAISWLPMAHIAERLCTHYLPMLLGWSVMTSADPRAIASTIADVRPGFFFSPPRLWEKLRAGVLASADDTSRRAIDAAVERVRASDGLQDGPVAQAVRAKLGFDQLRAAIVGAAPCPREVVEFWHGVGVPLGEVYGMSETTGLATVNPPSAIKIGTAGPALDGVEVALSDEGEILVRGPVVMAGYRNLPDKTAETIDPDGWLHSGDVGQFDDDGYLRIVDRIKEIIINAAGKNMSPANIEAAIKTSGELIGQVCVIGDGRPFNVALITLDADARAAFAAKHGDAAIEGAVSDTIEQANSKLARVEQIKRFTVLDGEWLPDGDELTPTMKLKRKPINEKYALEIEQLYA